MRVICIDDTDCELIQVGEIYTVEKVVPCPFHWCTCGRYYYDLKEEPKKCYNVVLFAPLSDLDETIIHADKIKEDSYV